MDKLCQFLRELSAHDTIMREEGLLCFTFFFCLVFVLLFFSNFLIFSFSPKKNIHFILSIELEIDGLLGVTAAEQLLTFETHFRLNKLPHTIYWNSPVSLLGM